MWRGSETSLRVAELCAADPSLIAWAEKLGMGDAVDQLTKTLDEEKATDVALTKLADSEINVAADGDGSAKGKQSSRERA